MCLTELSEMTILFYFQKEEKIRYLKVREIYLFIFGGGGMGRGDYDFK